MAYAGKLPIDKEKKADLLKLCRYLPQDCHAFYHNLPVMCVPVIPVVEIDNSPSTSSTTFQSPLDSRRKGNTSKTSLPDTPTSGFARRGRKSV